MISKWFISVEFEMTLQKPKGSKTNKQYREKSWEKNWKLILIISKLWLNFGKVHSQKLVGWLGGRVGGVSPKNKNVPFDIFAFKIVRSTKNFRRLDWKGKIIIKESVELLKHIFYVWQFLEFAKDSK